MGKGALNLIIFGALVILMCIMGAIVTLEIFVALCMFSVIMYILIVFKAGGGR